MSKEQQRLIEVDFPIREVSDASVHEKYIRKGNISALHTWWARRPLAASRATALAALIPDNARSRDELKDLVARISPWEIISDDDTKQPNPLIRKARELILDSFGGKPPRVLDCFAGGGAIPLEALRLGCETYALDYNPVAVLINKALLEYPQRYGKAVKQVSVEDGMLGLEVEHTVNPLVEAVRHWSDRVVQEASEELDRFYIKDPDGSIPVGYLWARTLTCENATCGAEIPLMHHTWLVRKSARKEALRLIPNRKKRRVDIAIARDAAIDFDPAEGTISQAHARCPVCGGTINDDTTRSLFREGKSGQRMIAVVLDHPRRTGKVFRVATSQDETLFEEARHALEEKRKKLWAEWGVDPLPDETIPTTELRRIAVPLYGLRNFADLFNARQALSLITFVEKIKAAHRQIVANTTDQDFGKAVVTYLALILDKLAMFSSTTCTWKVDTTQVVNAFVGRQAIQMTMDYFEMNPISGVSASWQNLADIALEALTPAALDTPVSVCQGSATDLPWGEGYFDAILTDPPYYDSVPYAHLADFFYIWLKRSLGDLYPDLFATPLSPKALEIVQDRKHSLSNSQKDKKYFESMLGKAFGEINRVLKPDGIAVIVFAHKTTDACVSDTIE